MTDRILHVEALEKAYGRVVALAGVDLSLEPGEIVGLLGPNGAGKTTLVSIICGLRKADAGQVTVNGVDALAHPGRAREFLGLAPQELGIYPIDTVRQNLSLFGELVGLRRGPLLDEIEALAVALQLDELLDRKAGELSGGQKRRLHTALALVGRPPLILLDEATVGADVGTRAALIDVVNDVAERGSAVLYSTHYLHEIEMLGAHVVIVDHGKVIAKGSVADLVSRHGSAYIELGFDGAPPSLSDRFDVRLEGERLRVSVDDPGGSMAQVLTALGSDALRLRSVDVISPSLEAVFLSLTGRRYDAEEGEAHVVAS